MMNLYSGVRRNQGVGKRACSNKYIVKTRLDFDSQSQTNSLTLPHHQLPPLQFTKLYFDHQLYKVPTGINSCADLQSS